MRPSPARAEPHDATAWLPLPDVANLPPVDSMLRPDPSFGPSTPPRDVPVGLPSPARSEPHDATTWLPLPDIEELPPIDDLLVPDPDVLPTTPRVVPVGLPSPARAEPHDATAWLPIPDLAQRGPDPEPVADARPRRAHRRPRLRVHLPVRSIAIGLVGTLVVFGVYYAAMQVLDKPDIELRVDGRVIKTESGAANVGAVLAERRITLGEHDAVDPAEDAPVVDNMHINVLRGFQVAVNVDGQDNVVYTTHHNPSRFLADVEQALSLSKDMAVRDAPTRITEKSVIQIRTKKQGTMLVDGVAVSYTQPVLNARELLEDLHVELGPQDYTKPYNLDDPLPNAVSVSVVRGLSEFVKKQEQYTLPGRRLPDPNASVQDEYRKVEGKAGTMQVTYLIQRDNGTIVKQTEVSRVPLIKAVPTTVYFGTKYDPRWDKMAECETGGNWDATGLKYQGGLGIYWKNWSHYGGKKYAPTAGKATKYEQIIVAERIKAENGWSAWGCNKRLHFSDKQP